MPTPNLKQFDDEIIDVKKQSLYARLKQLFSTEVIVRNVGGKQIKVKDTDNIMYATDRNSLRDRFNRIRSTAYNAYTRDFSLSYQAARMDLFRDYDTMDMDPIISSALDIYADECVHGDTIIPLLNGEKIKIKDLFDQSRKDFWVYSLNENGEIRPEKCERIACNGVKSMSKVILDDGTEIKCTANHQWVKSDMSIITTDKLERGTSLKVISSEKDYRISNNHRVVSIEYCGEYLAYDLVNVGKSTHLYAIETKDGSKLFTHNCLTYNEMGKMLTVHSNNNNVKQILENLFDDILTVRFNLWSWVRNMCKYGDFYLKLYITPEYGIYMVEPISAYNVERIENSDPYNKRYVKFQVRPTDTAQSEVLENYEVAHFRLMSDSNFLPYGKGMIEGARRVWKQLSLMEDAMLIHRIMRAPEKRIFYTDIGNIPPAEVDTYMQKMMDKMKKVPYMDEQTGEYNLRFNLQNMVEDYYIPVRGGDSGTKIDTLGGMEWTGTEDIEYLRNKLMAALKIPKAFLGYEEGISGKATLAAEDVRFARTIQRLQRIICNELTKIAIVHLYAQGYRDDSLVDFSLELTNPSTIFEKEKLEIWSDKISVATDMVENKFFSYDWIYKNIFNMSDDDVKEVKDQIVEDAKQRYRFSSIEEDGDDPAKPFKKIGGKGGEDDEEDEEGGLGDLGDLGGGGGGGGGGSGGLGGIGDLEGEEGGPPGEDEEEGGPPGEDEEEEEGEPEDLVRETKQERDQSGEHDARAQHPFGEDPLGHKELSTHTRKNSEGKRKSDISHNYEKRSPLHLQEQIPARQPSIKKTADTAMIKSLSEFLKKTRKDTKKELLNENNMTGNKSLLDENNILE
jgi:hypothetical protein